MTPEQIQQLQLLILGLAGPASGLAIAWISNRRSKRQVVLETTNAARNVRVSEKDAHTREIAMILDGYTKVNVAQVAAIARAEASASGCNEKYEALERRFDESERRTSERLNVLIDHIEVLEKMVPTPPGPPARPMWSGIERNES